MKKTFADEELEGLYQEFEELSKLSEKSFAAYAIWIGVTYDNWKKICGYFLEKGVDLKELLEKETFSAKSDEKNIEEENA